MLQINELIIYIMLQINKLIIFKMQVIELIINMMFQINVNNLYNIVDKRVDNLYGGDREIEVFFGEVFDVGLFFVVCGIYWDRKVSYY